MYFLGIFLSSIIVQRFICSFGSGAEVVSGGKGRGQERGRVKSGVTECP